ncbi:MAG: DMT family transporter [Thermofilaceae archaeon]|nr:DMT family transporter [Thermofilaceae archaeon]MCX8180467.1 DMT family transporter [Thermofilaceae archaeon]MDW8003336.1 DMT family transporter [Thermofilaceae archaeon]
MTSRRAVGFSALVALTAVWGTSFPAIKVVVREIGFLHYVVFRFAISTFLLAPVAVTRLRQLKSYVASGLALGLLYLAGISLQGWGMEYTSASNAAFVTGLSVVFVYVFETFLGREKASTQLASAIVLALIGLYLMSFTGSELRIMLGDVIVLAGSVCWALQIMVVDRFAKGDLLSLLFFESLFTTVGATAFIPLVGFPDYQALETALPSLVYLSTACTIGANALQLYGQRWISSVEAAFIYLLEPVFAAVFSFIALGETMSQLQALGAAAILSAMSISTLKGRRSS